MKENNLTLWFCILTGAVLLLVYFVGYSRGEHYTKCEAISHGHAKYVIEDNEKVFKWNDEIKEEK